MDNIGLLSKKMLNKMEHILNKECQLEFKNMPAIIMYPLLEPTLSKNLLLLIDSRKVLYRKRIANNSTIFIKIIRKVSHLLVKRP